MFKIVSRLPTSSETAPEREKKQYAGLVK
jgi:hypothetical protein